MSSPWRNMKTSLLLLRCVSISLNCDQVPHFVRKKPTKLIQNCPREHWETRVISSERTCLSSGVLTSEVGIVLSHAAVFMEIK